MYIYIYDGVKERKKASTKSLPLCKMARYIYIYPQNSCFSFFTRRFLPRPSHFECWATCISRRSCRANYLWESGKRVTEKKRTRLIHSLVSVLFYMAMCCAYKRQREIEGVYILSFSPRCSASYDKKKKERKEKWIPPTCNSLTATVSISWLCCFLFFFFSGCCFISH